MLEGLFLQINQAVPPVPPAKNQREPLELTDNKSVPLVPPIPSEKTKNKAVTTNSIEPPQDAVEDRQHCRDCRHLSNTGYCVQQHFRPVDDIPRRCDDFTDYSDRIGKVATVAPPEGDDLLVTVYTPSGIAMTIRAKNAEHAVWLQRMNPKKSFNKID